MKRARFTNEQIIQAGLALEQESRRVTGTALRQVLGGGSISRLLRVWRAYKVQPHATLQPLDPARPDFVIKVQMPQSAQPLKVKVKNGCLILLTGDGTEIAVPVFAQEGHEEAREAEATKTGEEGEDARQAGECEANPEADPTKDQECADELRCVIPE